MPVTDKVNLANLLPGPARVLYAPTSVAVPAKLDDIITMVSPWTAKAGRLEGGATTDAPGYDRSFEAQDFQIEQKADAVFSRITGTERSLEVPFAEITPELMKILEEGAAAVTIAVGAGASGTPAQTRQPFGSIGSLTRYRWAMIAERDVGVAPSGEVGRGKLVGLVLYNSAIAADSSGLEAGQGSLAGRTASFRSYPDPTISASGSESGCFLFETGVVIP